MQQYAETTVRGGRTEQIRKKEKAIFAVGILAVVLVVVLTAYVMGQFPRGMAWSVIPFTLLLILLTVWGVLCAWEGLRRDYEYAVSNESITVDCVIAQKRRKQLLHLELSRVTAYGTVSNVISVEGRTLLDATGTPCRAGIFYLDYQTETGPCRLYICPNQASLEILDRALYRVRRDLHESN